MSLSREKYSTNNAAYADTPPASQQQNPNNRGKPQTGSSGYDSRGRRDQQLGNVSIESFEIDSDDTSEADVEEAMYHLKSLELEEKCQHIKFKYEADFSNKYEIGDEVIPSDPGKASIKAVCYGKRKLLVDKHGRPLDEKVIVKYRSKLKSFKDDQEVVDWVRTMKLIHNLTTTERQEKRPNRPSYVATLPDICEDGEMYYIVMEYVRGRDLFDYFVQEKIYDKPYRLSIAKQLARQIIDGLAELHDNGLIHRDIKLENVVLDERNGPQTGPELYTQCKIVDFDTVEIYRPNVKSFHVLGTDQYIAPETYSGCSMPASDMWAVGVIFYTILTGTFPFHYALFDDQPGENYVGHARMDQIRRRLRIARIDWSNKVWTQDPLAKDFVKQCFSCDAKRRLTVQQAYKHPWLAGMGQSPTSNSSSDGQSSISSLYNSDKMKKLAESPKSSLLKNVGSGAVSSQSGRLK